MSAFLGKLTRWLGRRAEEAREVADGGRPVSTRGEDERETSTDEQVAGAAHEPWADEDS
jgi:hypothetical protein